MRRLEKLFVNSPFVSWYHRFRGVPRVLHHARTPLQGPLLEVGCGNGSTSRQLLRALPELPLTAIDYDPDQVARARRRLGSRATVEQGDVTRLRFADESCGTVVAMNVMHHIPDPRAGLREIHRVLAPGGQFLFMDYAWKAYPRLAQRFFPPDSSFTSAEFEGFLGAAGFASIELQGRRQFTGRADKRAAP